MSWIWYVLIAIAVFWVWFFFGSRFHCPVCGMELDDDWAYPGQKRRRCQCGWTDE